MAIKYVQDGTDRRRLLVDGRTLGWIKKWYKDNGIKMFAAHPIGASVIRRDCGTHRSAEAYILGYHASYITKPLRG